MPPSLYLRTGKNGAEGVAELRPAARPYVLRQNSLLGSEDLLPNKVISRAWNLPVLNYHVPTKRSTEKRDTRSLPRNIWSVPTSLCSNENLGTRHWSWFKTFLLFCACLCACSPMYPCMSTCLWRSEVIVQHLSWLLSTLFFKIGFDTETRVH